MPAAAQRKLVQSWCDVLPTLEKVEYLWFHSRVPQRLFDAACQVPRLKGLYIKWSGIKRLEAIGHASQLEAFHLGDSAQVESIECLGAMTKLRWLDLVNIKRVSRLDPLGKLRRLEGLGVEGSVWTTQRVETLAPIGQLANLRYLSIVNLRSADRTLKPLFALRRLEAFHAAAWWAPEEVAELRRRNRRLRPTSWTDHR